MTCADNVGASPSGKAPVFGSGIRRFESFRPSHFVVMMSAEQGVIVLIARYSSLVYEHNWRY